MTYCTQTDLENRFGADELIQLTDRASTGSIDTAVLDQAIADADALIDGYLAGRYSLPLSVVPTSLTRLACDITRYMLYDDAASDEVRNRYNDAVKFLLNVANNVLQLGADAAGDAPTTAGAPQSVGPTPIFTRDDLSDF